MQRCLSSQGTVEQPDFQPYVKLESERVTPKNPSEILDPSMQINPIKLRKLNGVDSRMKVKNPMIGMTAQSHEIYKHKNA